MARTTLWQRICESAARAAQAFAAPRPVRAAAGAARSPAGPPSSPPASPAPPPPPPPPAFTYPSADPGLKAYPVEQILAANAELLARLKLAYGCNESAFERDILSLLRKYAQFVNLLPATATNYFNDAGGLFRMGLEIGFFALQGSDGKMFGGPSTITSRRDLEPRWRLATLIAGLCGELHRTLSHVVVTDVAGERWPAYLAPLTGWLEARKSERFFVRWVVDAHEVRAGGVFALPFIVDREVLQYLSHENDVVVPHMMAAISGLTLAREQNVIDELVRRSAAIVISRSLQASADRYGKPQLGAHLERYLVDALRRLAASNPGWVLNAPQSRLWLAKDGLFILWPQAVADVVRLLDSEGLPGIPKAPETILEILIDAGVAAPRSDRLSTWLVCLPDVGQPQEAIKLAAPALLLSGIDPAAPLAQCIVVTAAKPPAPASASGRGAPGPAASPQRGPVMLHAVPATLPSSNRPGRRPEKGQSGDDCEIALPPSGISDLPTEPPPPPPDLFTGAATGAQSDDADAAVTPQPTPAAGPVARSLTLAPPLGLGPATVEALSRVLATFGTVDPWCVALPEGLFIPLRACDRQGTDPASALHALGDAGMLVESPSGGGMLRSIEFRCEETSGFVLSPAYVRGLPAARDSAPSKDR